MQCAGVRKVSDLFTVRAKRASYCARKGTLTLCGATAVQFHNRYQGDRPSPIFIPISLTQLVAEWSGAGCNFSDLPPHAALNFFVEGGGDGCTIGMVLPRARSASCKTIVFECVILGNGGARVPPRRLRDVSLFIDSAQAAAVDSVTFTNPGIQINLTATAISPTPTFSITANGSANSSAFASGSQITYPTIIVYPLGYPTSNLPTATLVVTNVVVEPTTTTSTTTTCTTTTGTTTPTCTTTITTTTTITGRVTLQASSFPSFPSWVEQTKNFTIFFTTTTTQ